jgi:uncharacterized protein (TIGR02466 family)
MKRETLWSEYVWSDDIHEVNFKKIIEYSYSLKSKFIGRQVSNRGGWQSDFIGDGECDEIDNLKPILNDKVNEIIEPGQKKVFAHSTWININPPNSFNIPHIHPATEFSAVFYIKSNETMGNICFVRRNVSEDILKYKQDVNICERPSITGKLYVFDGLLTHYVEKNLSDEDRISIAFNFLTYD